MNRSLGHLLNGRVRHDQPTQGFRSGIEPVLLAASIPARPGERVLEAGSGSGAALLCLAERVPGIEGIGLEREPALAALARDNAQADGRSGLSFVAADIRRPPVRGPFDHAFANPPYHLAPGTASPMPTRDRAKRADPTELALWAKAMAGLLRHRGTLTFILPAAHLPACLAAMTGAGCGVALVVPLWPRSGEASKLMIVRGIRGGRMPTVLHPGLVLHRPEGGFTQAADAVLRQGSGLFDAADRPQ